MLNSLNNFERTHQMKYLMKILIKAKNVTLFKTLIEEINIKIYKLEKTIL